MRACVFLSVQRGGRACTSMHHCHTLSEYSVQAPVQDDAASGG